MKCAKILSKILPRLLEHEGFKEALADVVSEIPITELEIIVSALPEGKTLTIGTLPEAANNLLANTVVEMLVTLKNTVEKRVENA